MNIKKGDTVQVIAGKDAGKKGKVLEVIPGKNRVIVEGINRVKRHQKPSRAIPQGGILSIEAPMDLSNVMFLCKKCNKPSRTGKKVLDNNEKVRVCRNCGEILD
jgi:large subunit ribosomal protein L24